MATLEQRVAALEAILSGDVYQSAFDGAVIDSAVGRAKTGGELDLKISELDGKILSHDGVYPNGSKGAVNCNNLSDGAWTISASATNGPGAFACTLFHKDWNVDFASQIAFGANRNVYYRVKTGGSWLAWQEMYSTLRYPSPSKIGAVAKSGDTMTGVLTVQNASYPDINLKNTGSGSSTTIRNSAHRTQIMSKEDGSNYRSLTLCDKSATTNPADILQIEQIESGVSKASYKVIHTGNLANYVSVKSKVVEYTGTGKNSVSVAVGFVPKLVVVQQVLSVSSSGSPYTMPLVFNGVGQALGLYRNGNSSDLEGFDIDVTAFGETISWTGYNYVEANNNIDTTYRVTAIG